MLTLPATGGSLLVRTDFSDDEAWAAVRAEVETETEEGFRAYVDFISDKSFDGRGWEAVRAAVPADQAAVLFIADTAALQDKGHPILVVSLFHPEYAPFRCVTSELWGVDNNLNISNMDWEEFAEATQDGVYRGFPPYDYGVNPPPPPPPSFPPAPQPVPTPPD